MFYKIMIQIFRILWYLHMDISLTRLCRKKLQSFLLIIYLELENPIDFRKIREKKDFRI